MPVEALPVARMTGVLICQTTAAMPKQELPDEIGITKLALTTYYPPALNTKAPGNFA
jgi:hypothetical protein